MGGSKERVLVRAGAGGRIVGLGFAAAHGESLSVCVLPKTWRTGPPVTRRLSWPEIGRLEVVAYEGDVLDFNCTAAQHGMIRTVMLAATQGEEADGLLAYVARPSNDYILSEECTGNFTMILDLVELFERSRVAEYTEKMPLARLPHPLLRAILYRRLVDEVEPLLRDLRPRYVEREDRLVSVRGRVSDASLAEVQLGGHPSLWCTFDELTSNTDLAIVILAALGVVARYGGSLQLARFHVPARKRAARLARALSTVPVVSRIDAAFRASRLHLSRFEQRFGSALELTRQVLHDSTVGPVGDDAVTDGMPFAFSVPTARLWEHILGVALMRLLPAGAVEIHPTIPSPWGDAKNARQPDFAAELRHLGQTWILDAKYKQFPTAFPNADDANQLFVYSHLSRIKGRTPTHAALLYASLAGQDVRVLERQPDRTFELRLASLPFPAPTDLRGNTRWESYLERLQLALHRVFES